MKRFLLSGIMLLSLGCLSASAQSNSNYNDDIYYNSDQAREDAQHDAKHNDAPGQQQYSSGNDRTYPSSGNTYNRGSDYNATNGDDYVDFDDEYYYSSHLNRFNYPFYNMGYYSGYYNPYWYDRNWVDPAWGYNPWRPAFSVSFGYGPYWSSGWGYSAWYGYTPFYSYYSYPYYGGFGGGSYGCGSPYYSGYWNGYYAGIYGGHYGGGYGYHGVSYGPRYSLNSVNNTYIRNSSLGHRSALYSNGATTSPIVGYGTNNPRSGFRSYNSGATGNNGNSVRNNTSPNNSMNSGNVRNGAMPSSSGNSGRDYFGNRGNNNVVRGNDNSGNVRSSDNGRANNTPDNNSGARSDRREGGFFGGRGKSDVASPRNDQGRQPRIEAPRSDNRSFSQPRSEQRAFSQPRGEVAPRSNGGGFGGGRSFGGGGRSSGGGGGFHGRR